MNCFYHPSITSVAPCVDCGKGLCQDCATTYSTPICRECNHSRIKSEKQSIIKELIVTILVGLTFSYFYWTSMERFSTLNLNEIEKTLLIASSFYVYASIVSGWKTLTAITPNIFLFLPIIGWVLFFIIKLFLSVFIGWFMLPIRWVRKIMRWRDLNKIEAIP